MPGGGSAPAAPPPKKRPAEAPAGASWTSLFLRDDPEAFPWTLAGIRVTGGEAVLVDHTVQPAAELALKVQRIELGELVLENEVG